METVNMELKSNSMFTVSICSSAASAGSADIVGNASSADSAANAFPLRQPVNMTLTVLTEFYGICKPSPLQHEMSDDVLTVCGCRPRENVVTAWQLVTVMQEDFVHLFCVFNHPRRIYAFLLSILMIEDLEAVIVEYIEEVEGKIRSVAPHLNLEGVHQHEADVTLYKELARPLKRPQLRTVDAKLQDVKRALPLCVNRRRRHLPHLNAALALRVEPGLSGLPVPPILIGHVHALPGFCGQGPRKDAHALELVEPNRFSKQRRGIGHRLDSESVEARVGALQRRGGPDGAVPEVRAPFD